MKRFKKILPLLASLPVCSAIASVGARAAEAEDTMPDFNQSNNGAQMAALFFVLVGVLIAGALSALIIPAILRKTGRSADPESPEDVRRRVPKNSFRKFWIVWGVIFLVLAIAAMIGMAVLNRVLTEYESIQPGYEAEKIFNEYFNPIDQDRLWQYVDYSTGDFETGKQARAYFSELLGSNGSETGYHEVISEDSTLHKYAVKVGDYTLGYFTVGKDESRTTDKYNYEYPKLDDIVIEIKPVYGVSVYAPEKSVVTVNGIEIGSDFAMGETVVMDDAGYFPSDAPAYRNMINYSITGLYQRPVVEVKAYEAVKYELIYDEASEKFTTVLGNPQHVEVKYPLSYDKEKSSYSAADSYLKTLVTAYNEAYEIADAAQQQAIYDKAFNEYMDKLLLAEAAEKTVLADAEAARVVSEEIKGMYEERVKYLSENLNKFFYVKTTTDSKLTALKLIEYGSEYYTKTQSYYNWGSYTVNTINYSGFVTDNYKWTNDKHTRFSCEVHLSVDIRGYRADKGATVDWSEPWDVVLEVSTAKNKSGLIYHVQPLE